MKTTISTKHEYLSGWTSYDMSWKTEYSGVRNKTIFTATPVSKTPFSTKIFKKWASEQGYAIEELFTCIENYKSDFKIAQNLCDAYKKEFGKNLDELNSQNKCLVNYTATINRNYKPLKTAFETYQAYNVQVRIEYKSGAIDIEFPSQGRVKNEACKMIVFSSNKLVSIYEEEEAIYKIKCRIEKLLEDCDTDEKFKTLPNKLAEVKKQLMKSFK